MHGDLRRKAMDKLMAEGPGMDIKPKKKSMMDEMPMDDEMEEGIEKDEKGRIVLALSPEEHAMVMKMRKGGKEEPVSEEEESEEAYA